MIGEETPDRKVLRISGADRMVFLQGLVTNDLQKLDQGLVYAALLSAQGKYLADFFLVAESDAILLDVQSGMADALVRRLSLYRLRADVVITTCELHVLRGVGPMPSGALADPRHPALGWRLYAADAGGPVLTDWDAIRVANAIPESGVELIPEESYILEVGFERLNGVDFRKGCYVGQEVTARMKYRALVRKRLLPVRIEGAEPAPGTAVTLDGEEVGEMRSAAAGWGLAFLRLEAVETAEREGRPLSAGAASLTPLKPAWWNAAA